MIDGVLQQATGAEDSPVADRDGRGAAAELGGHSAVDQLVDAMIRTGPYGDWFGAVPDGLSLAKLADNPHGIDLGPLQPRLPGALKTLERQDRAGVRADHRRPRPARGRRWRVHRDGDLVLVGRRHLRSNNSWMHNVNVLVKGKERCTLQVHPDDATDLGLVDGGRPRSRRGSASWSPRSRSPTRSAPASSACPTAGATTGPARRMAVAAAHAGVNSNMLTDEDHSTRSRQRRAQRHPGRRSSPPDPDTATMAAMEIAIEPTSDADVEELRQLNGAIRLGTQAAPSFATPEGLSELRAGGGLWAGSTVEMRSIGNYPGRRSHSGPSPRACGGRGGDAVPARRWMVHREREGRRSRSVRARQPGQRGDGEHRLPPGARTPLSRRTRRLRGRRLWLLDHARSEFGSDRLLIGGGSAGAHLSVVTLLRLRDRHDALHKVVAANLVAGAFDLGMTPSQRTSDDALVIPLSTLEACYHHFLPGLDREARRDPAISPLVRRPHRHAARVVHIRHARPCARRLDVPGQSLARRRRARGSRHLSRGRPWLCRLPDRNSADGENADGLVRERTARPLSPARGDMRVQDLTPNVWRLRLYNRVLLRGDLLAGITVAAYLIPQCMAYAELAGLPPIVGLWAVLAPMTLVRDLRSSPQLSVGPESTTAVMTAAALLPLALADPAKYAALAGALAILVGVICVIGFLLRLGFLADLLSRPILIGYMAGVAMIMIAGQLEKTTGVPVNGETFVIRSGRSS